jgi:hypothetical protein
LHPITARTNLPQKDHYVHQSQSFLNLWQHVMQGLLYKECTDISHILTYSFPHEHHEMRSPQFYNSINMHICFVTFPVSLCVCWVCRTCYNTDTLHILLHHTTTEGITKKQKCGLCWDVHHDPVSRNTSRVTPQCITEN